MIVAGEDLIEGKILEILSVRMASIYNHCCVHRRVTVEEQGKYRS